MSLQKPSKLTSGSTPELHPDNIQSKLYLAAIVYEVTQHAAKESVD